MTSYWLLKSEPASFSIDDLQAAPGQTTMWDGVRNYQARNFMRDNMNPGDQILFYHSVTNPGIVGLAQVKGKAYPDPTQFDPKAAHYDPKSPKEAPRWFLVDVTFIRKFQRPLSLAELRSVKELEGMELLRKGSRLSVQPVTEREFKTILALADAR